MEIKLKKYQTIYIIQLTGQLTLYSVEALKKSFQKLSELNVENFVIDLTQTDYIDSSGVGTLVQLKKTAGMSTPRKRFRVVNSNEVVRKIIQLTKLTEFLQLSVNLKEALIQMQTEIQNDSGKDAKDQVP